MADFIQRAQDTHEAFIQEREWNKYHNPKNVIMALSIEVSELMEHFQWLTGEESQNITDPKKRQNIKEEIADIFCYLTRAAKLLDIDIQEAFLEKMEQNRAKYPVELAKGQMTKYDQLRPSSEIT